MTPLPQSDLLRLEQALLLVFASGGSQSDAVESLLRDAGPHRHHMEQLLQTAILDTHLDDRSRALDRMLGAAPVV